MKSYAWNQSEIPYNYILYNPMKSYEITIESHEITLKSHEINLKSHEIYLFTPTKTWTSSAGEVCAFAPRGAAARQGIPEPREIWGTWRNIDEKMDLLLAI